MFHHIYGQLQGKFSFGKFCQKVGTRSDPPSLVGTKSQFFPFFLKAPLSHHHHHHLKLKTFLDSLMSLTGTKWAVADSVSGKHEVHARSTDVQLLNFDEK